MNPSAPTPEQQPIAGIPEIPAIPEPHPVAPAQSAPASLPVIPISSLSTPAPVLPASDIPVMTPIIGAPPAVADDVDVIEKEWVDQAEAVVKRTEGDPHAEEEAVEALQVDYLKKRYDHSVEKPAD
jgi:hypothetical protein